MTFLHRRSRDAAHGPLTSAEVDYLLSAGRLSGAQHDDIFAAVAAAPVRKQKGGARTRVSPAPRIAAGAAILAGAIAGFLLWARTVTPDHFQSKGGSDRHAPSIDTTCLHASLRACPRGSILAFSAKGASPDMFVTATLEPLGSGPRQWLLWNETASPSESGLLAHGARVPDQQAPGDYRILVVVTRHPLGRDLPTAPSPHDLVGMARWDVTVVP